MKRKVLAILSAAAVGCAALLAGCNQTTDIPNLEDGTVVIEFAATQCDQYAMEPTRRMVEAYNNGQGKIDKVYVQAQYNTGDMGSLSSMLSRNCRYNVVTVSDTQFKTLAVRDYFLPLDDYLTDEIKETLDWDSIPDGLLDRWRLTAETDENGFYHAGKGTNLLGISAGDSPLMLFYNEEIFEGEGINIISVEEEALDDYNAANGTQYQPHGYAEYSAAAADWAEAAGLESSTSYSGTEVYKVFNNRIPMNWEELRCVARDFTQEYGGDYNYGYMSEWWFYYGWSVGGDCVGWDEEQNRYIFTIGDQNTNWLAIDDVTVNGTDYKKGEVLDYEDSTWLHENGTASVTGKVHELPSQYDAFLEFNRLGVPSGSEVAEGVSGYGVAASTLENKNRWFTSGQSPMLVEGYYQSNNFKGSAVDGKINIAPVTQYREYVGGSTYQKDGEEGFANECLKIIGETYDGEVYTGELNRAENGTPIVGEAKTSSLTYAYCIPRNSDAEEYEAAMKFLAWIAGPEGQAIYCESENRIPNQTSYSMSESYYESDARNVDNAWAAAFASQNTWIGDWSYFNVSTWINDWADDLNVNVRNGSMTLTAFLDTYESIANNLLSAMRIRTKGI